MLTTALDDQSMLQPAAAPEPPASGGTTTLHVKVTVPKETAEAARHLLANGLTTGTDALAALLRSVAPAETPKPKSHPAAQALMSGQLSGLGEKYGDANLGAAGQGLADRLVERKPLAAAKPSKKRAPRAARKARRSKP